MHWRGVACRATLIRAAAAGRRESSAGGRAGWRIGGSTRPTRQPGTSAYVRAPVRGDWRRSSRLTPVRRGGAIGALAGWSRHGAPGHGAAAVGRGAGLSADRLAAARGRRDCPGRETVFKRDGMPGGVTSWGPPRLRWSPGSGTASPALSPSPVSPETASLTARKPAHRGLAAIRSMSGRRLPGSGCGGSSGPSRSGVVRQGVGRARHRYPPRLIGCVRPLHAALLVPGWAGVLILPDVAARTNSPGGVFGIPGVRARCPCHEDQVSSARPPVTRLRDQVLPQQLVPGSGIRCALPLMYQAQLSPWRVCACRDVSLDTIDLPAMGAACAPKCVRAVRPCRVRTRAPPRAGDDCAPASIPE